MSYAGQPRNGPEAETHMANLSPQTPASRQGFRSRPGGPLALAKTLWDTLWLPAVLLFGFCLCYALPFHAQTRTTSRLR
jgi:hypothetical protein